MIQDYTILVDKISKASGKEREEIDRLVEAKRARLSGLISREGAAQIVAAELGISFDKAKVKINEIMPGMRRVNVVGRIVQVFPVRDFKKNDREGRVANLVIADETGNIKVVLWDTNHILLVDKKEIKEEDVVEIRNANLRNTELHLSAFSDIKKTGEKMENVKLDKEYFERKITELSLGGNFKTRAVVVQVFEPKFFEVCPECKSRVLNGVDGYVCQKHGKVMPEKRVLISIVLDDGSSSMRAILFTEQIEKLGFKQEDLQPEIFFEKRLAPPSIRS